MTHLEAINAQIAIKIRELDALRAEREALSPSPPVDLHPYAVLRTENEALRTTIRDAHTTLSFLRIRTGEDYAFGSFHVQRAWNQLNEAMK